MKQKRVLLGLICCVTIWVFLSPANAEEVILSESFELGIPPSWTIDNGVWELCLHSEPQPWGGGSFYVVTECDGNYPGETDSRLFTPALDLPVVDVSNDEEIHLRFWQLFSYAGGTNCDYGLIQISIWDESLKAWSTWTTIGNRIANTSPWSKMVVDLTEYAGEKVRIAFYHTARGDNSYPDYCGASSTGWYLDDVEIIKKVPQFTGDFESGWDDWGADRGIWQVGEPETGPAGCYSGSSCAGTFLGGNYHSNTDSRLISATIPLEEVTGDEEIHLRFWQWFSYGSNTNCDVGRIQISEWDEDLMVWTAWTNIGNWVGNSSDWSRMSVDITEHAGKYVRIAFYHTARGDNSYPDYCGQSSLGWYIDDIEVIKAEPDLTWDFECGWDDWSAGRGVWQIGQPSYGTQHCWSGSQCVGTVLDGNYPGFTDSRLTSPSIDIPEVFGPETISMLFHHYFSYAGGPNCDAGYIQISSWDEIAEAWSSWETLSTTVNFSDWASGNIDLTAYAGMKVRVAFYHTARGDNSYPHYCGASSSGWFVDHIRIQISATGPCEPVYPALCECDLNKDGSCNGLDWLFFYPDWGRGDCNDEGVEPCECDLNKDGSCNGLDWLRFYPCWNRQDCAICD